MLSHNLQNTTPNVMCDTHSSGTCMPGFIPYSEMTSNLQTREESVMQNIKKLTTTFALKISIPPRTHYVVHSKGDIQLYQVSSISLKWL